MTTNDRNPFEMDPDYTFTMSLEDQERFVNIPRETNFGDMIKVIKKRLEDAKDNRVNFKDESSSKFILALIDKKIMRETIGNFPLDLALNDRKIYHFSNVSKSLRPNEAEIYDVRFMIPLIYHGVSPGLFVDCRDFIAKRCLALVLIGLSSEDPQMRSLCYKTLERYYEHLLSALLIDKQLWINLLDLIRNSIPLANTRLKFIFATFLSKIIDTLLHPDKDKLYQLIKEFLAGKPRLRIDTIEIYDDLLFCSDGESYNHNLRWLMTLFRDGLKCNNDLNVAKSLNLIPQAMCLYNSALRFERANETIMSIFISISSIQNGSKVLVNEYSFLPWLHHVILFHLHQDVSEIKRDPKSESLVDITKSISSLVFTLIDHLMKSKDDTLSLSVLLELLSVFIALHSLVIKSKSCPILEYYLDYVRVVNKQIRKRKKIPDQLAGQMLELVKAKITCLS